MKTFLGAKFLFPHDFWTIFLILYMSFGGCPYTSYIYKGKIGDALNCR